MKKFAAIAAGAATLVATAGSAFAASPAPVMPKLGCWSMPSTPKTCTEHWPSQPWVPSPEVEISQNFVGHPYIDIINDYLWCFGSTPQSVNEFNPVGAPEVERNAPAQGQIFSSAVGGIYIKNGRFSKTVTAYTSDARFKATISGRFFTPTTGTMTISTTYPGCGTIKQALKVAKVVHFNTNK